MANNIIRNTGGDFANPPSLSIRETKVQKRWRGQIMIEFFLYIGIFIFIVISGYFVITFIQNSEISTRESTITRELGEGFKDAVILAVRAGEGFNYTITFPKNILSKPYVILFDDANSMIIITWEGTYANVSYPFTIPAYNYEFQGCLAGSKTLVSNNCDSIMSMRNDGEKLIIKQ